jgi:urea transport system substrate-binding protein
MSDEPNKGLPSPLRRKLLLGAAALPLISMLPRPSFGAGPATATVNTTGLAVTDTKSPSASCTRLPARWRSRRTGSIQAEKLAIEQINAAGGVLGRKIKFIQEDGASDWPTFAEKAKKLLVNDKVAAIMGCWTSASRKAVLPVMEQYNGMLYYPTFYEGLEQSKNVIYTGQEATQQILAGLNWIAKEKGAKSFFFIGSDYIWPRTSNKIARKHVENVLKGKVVGEEYYALGITQFNSVINKIKLTKPDVIFTDVVGGSNVAFYKQLKAAGIDLSKQALLTISVTEDEIDGIGGENIAGAYACMKYFQSLDNAEQQDVRARLQEDVGREDRDRRRHAGRLSRPVAVEIDRSRRPAASTSTRSPPLRPASNSRARPKATVRIHENHHLWSKTRVGKAKLDGQFELIFETADLVEPDPFPKGYQ